MIKNKIFSIVAIAVFSTSSLSAQDDVSIMDLKETVYLLMKDVQGLKGQQQKVLGDTKSISTMNIRRIDAMLERINALEKQMRAYKEKQILPDYKVSKTLLNYIAEKK
jgi:hypothetical protein